MDTEEYRKKLEQDILDIMGKKLIAGQMNAKRAHEIAQSIVDLLKPRKSLEQIYNVALSFETHFPELIPALLPVVQTYADKVKEIVSVHVDKLIKEGKIEEANNLIKKALNNEVSVGE